MYTEIQSLKKFFEQCYLTIEHDGKMKHIFMIIVKNVWLRDQSIELESAVKSFVPYNARPSKTFDPPFSQHLLLPKHNLSHWFFLFHDLVTRNRLQTSQKSGQSFQL